MDKKLKIFLIVLGSLLGLAIIAFIILYIFVTALETAGTRMFESAYSDEDIKEYVEDTHDFKVRIIENEGREPSSFGGLSMKDAIVETVDEDRIEFTVYISTFGNITGDNYKDVVARSELNEQLPESVLNHQLQELGFTNIQFGDDESDDAFSMSLPSELSINDAESLQIIYESIPTLKELQAKAKEKDIDVDVVHVDDVEVDLQVDYTSWEDFANKLANENIDSFAAPYTKEVNEKMEDINEDLNEVHFNTERPSTVECLEMDGYDDCAAYSLILQADYETEVQTGTMFHYDDDESKQNFLDAMDIINEAGLSFDKVFIENAYVPDEEEDQIYTEEELEEQDGVPHFVMTRVEVENVNEVSDIDDITFTYSIR